MNGGGKCPLTLGLNRIAHKDTRLPSTKLTGSAGSSIANTVRKAPFDMFWATRNYIERFPLKDAHARLKEGRKKKHAEKEWAKISRLDRNLMIYHAVCRGALLGFDLIYSHTHNVIHVGLNDVPCECVPRSLIRRCLALSPPTALDCTNTCIRLKSFHSSHHPRSSL
jgi:hypothetical protein